MGTINEDTTRAAMSWAAKRLRWEQRLEELRTEFESVDPPPLLAQPAQRTSRQRRVRPRPAAHEV